MEPNIYRRWIYNLAYRESNGDRFPISVEKALHESKEIEFKEHPQAYRAWMGKQLNLK